MMITDCRFIFLLIKGGGGGIFLKGGRRRRRRKRQKYKREVRMFELLPCICLRGCETESRRGDGELLK